MARLRARSFDGHFVKLTRDSMMAAAMSKEAQIQSILAKFLSGIDYRTMGDFFLTFRSFISTTELLTRLIVHYDSCSLIPDAAAIATRIRVFVALRHWILNYFIDDFLLNAELCEDFVSFLRTLGGIGADEITTEARISKELHKIWSRECTANSINHEGPFRRNSSSSKAEFDDQDIIRSRLALQPIATSPKGPSTKAPATAARRQQVSSSVRNVLHGFKRSFRRQDTSRKQNFETVLEETSSDLLLTNESPIMLNTSNPFIPAMTPPLRRKRLSSLTSSSLSMVACQDTYRQTEHLSSCSLPSAVEVAHSPETVRTLKRKPGGNLAKAKVTADLEVIRSSVDTFVSRASFRPYLALCERNTEVLTETNAGAIDSFHRPAFNIVEMHDFVKNLITVFDDDEEPDRGKFDAVNATLEKLEGASQLKRSSSAIDSNMPSGFLIAENDVNPGTRAVKGSEKRQRKAQVVIQENTAPVSILQRKSPAEEVVLSDADSFVLPFEDRMKAAPAASDFVQQMIGSEVLPTTESIVEALAIPSCSVTKFGSIWLSPKQHRPFILDHNPAHVAQQITNVEIQIFMELDWLELCSSSWLSSTSEVLEEKSWDAAVAKQVSGLSTIVARFNLSIQWLISEIVLSTVLSIRVQTMIRMIEVAQLCRTYNNYTSVVQIVMALQHPLVRNLKRTWRYIDKASLTTLKDLETLVMPLNSWSLLRSVQEKQLLAVNGQVVPFLGPYLSELLLLETANPPLDIPARTKETASLVKILLQMLDRAEAEVFPIDPELIEKCIWIRSLDEEEMGVCVSKCV